MTDFCSAIFKVQIEKGLAANCCSKPKSLILCLGDVPNFFRVLANGTVGGELGCGSHIHQALAAEGLTVGVVPVCLQLSIQVRCIV